MVCCSPMIFPFAESVTEINYNADMLDKYGAEPNVQVFYKDGSEYVLSDDMSLIKFDGITITVDHGGPQIGFIKVF